MKINTTKFGLAFLILTFTIANVLANANVTFKDERIRLKNGKSKSEITLNPSRTYRFVISGKQFKKLNISLKTSGGKYRVQIKSPKSKTLANSIGKRFAIKNIGAGDYQILITNVGKEKGKVIAKFEGVDGES